ncbi:major facilitator superfamily domain-containing protein [Xylariaceae sp. FL1272]|nr:major facilitator superfamily domain-containing protein [Xylariaceae sp. FL1272]
MEHTEAGMTEDEPPKAVTDDGGDSSSPDENHAYVTGLKLALLVASIAMACFLVLIDTMVVSTAIPKITDEFKSLADVGWYASAYQFGSAAPQPLAGKVYTYFNSKWSFIVFFTIFEIGSLLCGAANSSNLFIVARAIAGFGGAGVINGALTIVSDSSPMEKRPGLIGITMGVNQLGLIIGPLIGGAFTSYVTWRWSFYNNLPLGGLVLLAFLFMRIPEQISKPRPLSILPHLHNYLDLLGFALFTGAVLQLLLAFQFGGVTFPWRSSQVIGLFVGTFVTFLVWFYWNIRKGDDALLPYSMISRQAVWSAGLYQAILLSVLYGSVFYLPIYFQAINGSSAILSGVYLLPAIVPQLIFAVGSGFLLGKVGYVIPFAIFSTVLLSNANGLYSLLQPGSPTGWWVGFQVLGGVGSGAGLQVAIIATQAATPGKQLSSAMAFIVFCQSLGPAIVLSVCQLIFIHGLQTELPRHAPNVDAASVIQAGATRFRALIDSQDLPKVLVGYATSIDQVFYLLAGLSAFSGFVLWGMGWQDIRKKPAKSALEGGGDDKQDGERVEKEQRTNVYSDQKGGKGCEQKT